VRLVRPSEGVNDGALAEALKHEPKRYSVVNGQWCRGFADFFGTENGLLSNMAIDITTKAGYAKHVVRGYLEKGLILTY
jgi:hypothetical protein